MKNKKLFAGLLISLLATSCSLINPSTSSSSQSTSSTSSSSSSSTSSSSSSSQNGNLSIESSAPSYYDDLRGLYGDDLSNSLSVLITNTHSYNTTYDEIRYLFKESDIGPSGKMMTFYAHAEIDGTWDGGTTYNREHVWPQSLGWFKTSGAGSDLHHIRPTITDINSTRGNHPYGDFVESDQTAVIKNGYLGGYFNGTYFEPLDHSKGDIARILLYLVNRYDIESANYSITSVVQSVDMLLDWNELDPVDDHEMYRNNYIYALQGNRNPFIDHPEFVNMIYDKSYTGSGALNDQNGGNAELSDEQKVQQVIDAINAIGTVTLESENDILRAENLYNKLPSELKGNVANLYNTLTEAREKYEQLVEEENKQNNNDNPVVPGSVAKFEFGANGDATHKDNNTSQATYTETQGSYTFNYTNGVKAYPGSVDAKGNGALKIGTGSAIGSFTFEVPTNINKVIIYVAQYKANNTTISINGKQYSITTPSNNGEYTAIEVDTTTVKTINFSTVSGGQRCMINAIEYCE